MSAAFLIIGALFRFFMLISEKSFWGDEWFSIGLVAQSLPDVFWGSIRDVHPPLYFLMLRMAVWAFGETEVAFRLISFLSSIGTLIMLYFLAKKVFGRSAAKTALLLAAVSPYWLQSSNEVRSYSLLAFVASSAIFLFIKILENPRSKIWLVLYFLAGATSVYIEHYAWFLILGFTAVLAWKWLREKTVLKTTVVIHISVLLTSLPSLVLIAYQAIFFEHMLDVSRVQEYWRVSILLKKIVGLFWHFSCGYFFSMLTVEQIRFYLETSWLFWLSVLLSVFATSLAIKALVGCYKERKKFFILFMMTLIFPVVLLAIFYSIRLDARYLSFAAVPFFILLSQGAAGLKNRWIKVCFFVLYGFVALTGSFASIFSTTDAVHKEDYHGMVQYVLKNARTSDAVFGLSPQFEYYRQMFKIPFRGEYFQTIDAFLIHARSFKRVWLLDGLNMHPDVSFRNYETNRKWLLKVGFFPSGEAVRFGGKEGLVAVYLFNNPDHVGSGVK